ncbi:hypothetical protein FOMPIDRAFT_1056663 [Fomitopsis schrenkii]|uniref:Uncharacterized protein n=1 Tax=Fomitopsis schrenkii TaxID=2126942 RepID=S8ESA7_FOMSC|nr:hypothetical protein FOMPIDRAFT_1056663 [Fomitopsis schrenkii]
MASPSPPPVGPPPLLASLPPAPLPVRRPPPFVMRGGVRIFAPRRPACAPQPAPLPPPPAPPAYVQSRPPLLSITPASGSLRLRDPSPPLPLPAGPKQRNRRGHFLYEAVDPCELCRGSNNGQGQRCRVDGNIAHACAHCTKRHRPCSLVRTDGAPYPVRYVGAHPLVRLNRAQAASFPFPPPSAIVQPGPVTPPANLLEAYREGSPPVDDLAVPAPITRARATARSLRSRTTALASSARDAAALARRTRATSVEPEDPDTSEEDDELDQKGSDFEPESEDPDGDALTLEALANRIRELERRTTARFEALEPTVPRHMVARLTQVETVLTSIQRATGPALDRRFQVPQDQHVARTAAVYSNLGPRIDSIGALSQHTHRVALAHSESLGSAVSELVVRLACTDDRIEALATLIDEVANIAGDPAVLDALATVETTMQNVLEVLRAASYVRRRPTSSGHSPPAPSVPSAPQPPSASTLPSASPVPSAPPFAAQDRHPN